MKPFLAIELTQIFGIVGLIFLLCILLMVGSFLSIWLKAYSSGAPVSMMELVAMRYLRRLPYSIIVDAHIMAVKAGLPVTLNDLETHFMAGGDIIQTVSGLINAQKEGIRLEWDQACSIDLAIQDTGLSFTEALGLYYLKDTSMIIHTENALSVLGWMLHLHYFGNNLFCFFIRNECWFFHKHFHFTHLKNGSKSPWRGFVPPRVPDGKLGTQNFP